MTLIETPKKVKFVACDRCLFEIWDKWFEFKTLAENIEGLCQLHHTSWFHIYELFSEPDNPKHFPSKEDFLKKWGDRK